MNSKPVRDRWNAIRHPVTDDKREALLNRWNSLPEALRTRRQISGKQFTHCGFVTGASYCSFHCTHCYLPENANRARIPSLQEMRAQIEANRRLLGPGGGLQITGGDVADAYWRAGRSDELVEIIRHAVETGLLPILMTHGQTLMEQPAFLERLVVEGGLRQISLHIDMTQAGRKGFPIQRVEDEADLHPVREAFTQLVLDLHARTGILLSCALTCTVTQRNVKQVPEVLRWHLENTGRTGVWRMLAFMPEADTGRTQFSAEPVTPERVWNQICAGTGIPLQRDAVNFGHPDCNSWAPLLVSRSSGRIMNLFPDDDASLDLFVEALDAIGGIPLGPGENALLPYRLFGALVRRPGLALRLVAGLGRLALAGKFPLGLSAECLIKGAHPVSIYMHNFMSTEQVDKADQDPTTRLRLDGCVFKGTVQENGEWVAKPMCAMNQSVWKELLAEREVVKRPSRHNEESLVVPIDAQH